MRVVLKVTVLGRTGTSVTSSTVRSLSGYAAMENVCVVPTVRIGRSGTVTTPTLHTSPE